MNKAIRMVMGVGKATVFTVGLAVILALVFGVVSTAFAANGGSFLLGKQNVATAVTTLTKQGSGAALSLIVKAGQAPFTVNSSGLVKNLNADKIDGKDSTSFLAANARAADADKLDGRDSSEFALAGGENWKVVDSDFGGSGFYVAQTGQCGTLGRPNWMDIARFGNDWATAAYFKDGAKVVHLKGQIRDNSSCYAEYDAGNPDAIIFVLPAGYRPSERQSFATTSNHNFGEVLIRPDGAVIAYKGSLEDFSLNGISFRTAN